jgi:hypothetical protein
MNLPNPQFEPLFDREHFPILAAGGDTPVGDLLGCDSISFCYVPNGEKAESVITQPGRLWHQYGDVRWPWPEVWVEFDPAAAGYRSLCGVLIKRCAIPAGQGDVFSWVANNGPLFSLFVDVRGEQEIRRLAEALRTAQSSALDEPMPDDEVPAHVQSYCLYRKRIDSGAVLEARYTDLLNASGQIIPRYRNMLGTPTDLDYRRFALHAVCTLNAERQRGLEVVAVSQLSSFSPVLLAPGDAGPDWARFHPMRILRPRPAVRALPTSGALTHGIMKMETMERVSDACRAEYNRHNLAFAREARPVVSVTSSLNDVLTAFVHKCHGAAIYSLPNALTEEFLHTDCHEIHLEDLKLPFQELYLSFQPPELLMLGPGAYVDGCYVCKQSAGEPGDVGEFLLVLTSRRADTDYGRSLSVTCTDPTFSIHLPIGESGRGYDVEEAVELGIAEFLEKNAPPEEDMSQEVTLPNGYVVQHLDIRAQSRARRVDTFLTQEPVFRTCLNIIFNALCFISFRPEDITEEWDRDPPAWVIEALADTRDTRRARDRRFNARQIVATNDYARIMVCGKKLFEQAAPVEGGGQGESPRAHWRRGHWRRQRHGPGLTQIALRWIRPTLVKPDNGPIAEARIYDVEPDGAGERKV